MSILTSMPPNSQVKIAKRPSIEKSAWLMPAHCGVASDDLSAIVCGSRKSSRLYASATTIASLPSGVKYMLYGSSTAIALPGLPVFGIDRRQAALGRVLGVVGDPERLQVPRRHDVLRVEADLEAVDDLEGRRVDDVDVVRLQVGNVDARQRAARRLAQLAGAGVAVEVARDRSPAACRGRCRSRGGGAAARGEAGAAEAAGATRADDAADAGCAPQSKATSAKAATQAGRRKDGFSFKSEAPERSPHSQRRARRSDDTLSPPRDLALDRIAGARDDQVDAGPAGGRAGTARIAVHAVGRAERAAVVQERRADELLVDGERQRGVGGAGVRADLGVAEALLAQAPARSRARRRGSTRRSRARARPTRPTRGRAWRRPWPGSPGSRRDRRSGRCRESRRWRKLRAAPSSVASNALSGMLIVPAKRMWPAGGSIAPSGTYAITGATSALPRLAAMRAASARARTLCLPSAMCGPLCSVPPTGTITVVLPALIASRSSVQVSSSTQHARRRRRGGDLGRGGGEEHGGEAVAKQGHGAILASGFDDTGVGRAPIAKDVAPAKDIAWTSRSRRRTAAADRHAACPGAFMSTRQRRPASPAPRRGRSVALALSIALHAVVFAALAVHFVGAVPAPSARGVLVRLVLPPGRLVPAPESDGPLPPRTVVSAGSRSIRAVAGAPSTPASARP